MRRLPGLLCALLVAAPLAAPSTASAHARLMDPTPRFDPPANPGGIKEAAAPCGATKPAAAAHTYVMGTTLMVKIDETIVHPGHYELWWSATTDAALAVIPGMNNIVNADLKQVTTVAWTLPNVAVDNGTLQLRMFMSDSNTNYYSCADIKLVPPGADLAGVMPADLAIATDADLAGFGELDDLSATTDDAGAETPDMATDKKPPAESAGLPGCSMTAGSGSALPLALLLGALFLTSIAPTLRRAIIRRRRP